MAKVSVEEKLVKKLTKELEGLNTKREKLRVFLEAPDTFGKVGYKHNLVLKRQLKNMDGYAVALQDRIALLNKKISA